jgi:hypothetical protein
MVVWKYKNDLAQVVREEHITRLRALSQLIPDIISLNLGFDTLHLARSYDTGLVAVFRDRAALDAYTAHPVHQQVAEFGRSISEHIASVDFVDENDKC